MKHMGFQFPDQGQNLCPLYWKGRILTTGPRVGSPNFFFVCATAMPDLSSPSVPAAAEVQSSNHWTTRKFPALIFIFQKKKKMHKAVIYLDLK